MSEEIVIKHKTEVLPILRKLMPAKSEKTAKEEEKQAYIRALTECIQDAYEEWQYALKNFEDADNKDLIDYYSYRIKASQIRYEYLLRKVKEAQV